jgi:hypothetical protein
MTRIYRHYNESNSDRQVAECKYLSIDLGLYQLTFLFKSIDDIKVSEVPKPQASNNEVIVQIAAAGVNFVDQLYVERPPFVELFLTHSRFEANIRIIVT